MFVRRDGYLQKLIDYKDKDLIKVVTGVRRSGKSFLLFTLYGDWLLGHGVDAKHIIKINLEDLDNVGLRDSSRLYEYVRKQMTGKKKYYVFLDEIQYIDGFEEVVNSLKLHGADVYVTGSNSKMLSGEINTVLRGRSIEIRVMPLSFAEYFGYVQGDVSEAFKQYVLYGGFPFVALEKDVKSKKSYLQMLESTVATKDIVERQHLRNASAFEAVYNFLCSNIGSLTSVKKLTDTLRSNGYNGLTVDTVGNYLQYLCDAFLFTKAYRYDVKGKAYLKTQNKYYITDLGLRNVHLNYRQVEITHALENIVYNELLRRGYIVNVGKNRDKEIDFVVSDDEDTYYVQVAYTLVDEAKKNQELAAFFGLDDGYKKIIITMDNDPFTIVGNGYKKIHVFDFLLNEKSLAEV